LLALSPLGGVKESEPFIEGERGCRAPSLSGEKRGGGVRRPAVSLRSPYGVGALQSAALPPTRCRDARSRRARQHGELKRIPAAVLLGSGRTMGRSKAVARDDRGRAPVGKNASGASGCPSGSRRKGANIGL